MILLLGGTGDTAPVATGLAEAGHDVLVSTATTVALNVGDHPRITRRSGPLAPEELTELLRHHGVRAIVDTTHPYAAQITQIAFNAARAVDIPYLRYVRPSAVDGADDVLVAEDHDRAAALAFSFGRPVLATTGSKNIAPYVQEARRSGVGITARILPEPASLDICRQAGLTEEELLPARGPFSVEENRRDIRECGAGVLVMKDSGTAGGTEAKLQAARTESCHVVLVRRPPLVEADHYDSLDELSSATLAAVPAE